MLLLPARVSSSIPSMEPSPTWRNTNVTALDIHLKKATKKTNNPQPYYNTNAFDGGLMRRLCAEYPVMVQEWRLLLHITGVIHRGCKTLKQMDIERWDYDTVAAMVSEYFRHANKGKIVQMGLPLIEAA